MQSCRLIEIWESLRRACGPVEATVLVRWGCGHDDCRKSAVTTLRDTGPSRRTCGGPLAEEMGGSNEQGEMPDVERAGVTGRGRPVRPVHRLMRRVCPAASRQVQPGSSPLKRGRQLVVNRKTLTDDDFDAVDEDGIRVVLLFGQRLGRGRRLRVRFGWVVPILVVIVVAVWTVVMVAVIVTSRSRSCVKMRTEVVSGRLATAVRMAERG